MSFPVRKTLKGRRAVVIGSGPGGLSAAISLAVRGARVVVVEKGPVICGALEQRRRGEYLFDTWPVGLTHPHHIAELFASAGVRLTDFVTLQQFDPVCRFILPDGEKIDLSHDSDSFAAQVARLDAADARVMRQFLRRASRASAAFQRLRTALPEHGALSTLNTATLRAAGDFAPLRTYAGHIKASFRDPRTRALMHSVRTLSGLPPRASRGGAAAFLADLQQHGGWYIEGGLDALRLALLRLCDILGIRFVRNARVENIELQGGHVRRIQGPGFKPLAASLVVSNVEVQRTYRDLLPKSEEAALLVRQWKRLRRAPSSMIIEAGANAKWSLLRPLTVFPSPNPVEESRFLDRWRLPANHPTIAVADLSQVVAGAAREGRSALLLRVEMPPVSARFAWNEAHTREAVELVYQALEERGLQGIRGAIEEEAVLTPADMEKRSSFDWGSGGAWMVRGPLDLRRLPANRSTIVPGLYFAGATAFPGPGLENVILSGMIAAMHAAEDAR